MNVLQEKPVNVYCYFYQVKVSQATMDNPYVFVFVT